MEKLFPDGLKIGTVAIIPARGNSQAIPRKNARLLNGVPLIAHVVRAAQLSRGIDAIFVSTDNSEIAELATRSQVPVLHRASDLAGPNVTLDEVLVDAVTQLEERGILPERVVTLQPTCPLISPRTIDAAIAKCREENLETVLTVVDDRHLTWGLDPDGNAVPEYQERVNRQQLAPSFRESGAVVVATREVIRTGTRFGTRVGLVEVSKQEAIDIDDNFDWWLAEKSLNRRRIVFHVVGNERVGLGHVYRALTLADRLIDHEVLFLVNEESTLAAEIIRRRFYAVEVVQAGSELERLIVDMGPDLVINDILNSEADFVESLSETGVAVVNFEDLGSGSEVADRVINAMHAEHPSRRDPHVYHGIEHCCLRDEFYSIEPIEVRPEVENILLLFGGSDPNGTTQRTLRWLDGIDGDFRITVIAGIGFQGAKELDQIAKDAVHPVEIVYDTQVVSRYMAKADLAITSAGRTVFELAAVAVPMVVVASHERERSHVFARTSGGTVFLGTASELQEEKFRATVDELLRSELLRTKMSESLRAARPHEGVERVLGIIREVLAETEQTRTDAHDDRSQLATAPAAVARGFAAHAVAASLEDVVDVRALAARAEVRT